MPTPPDILKEIIKMEKIDIRVSGSGKDALAFRVFYDGELLTEELIAKDSKLWKWEVKDVAEKLLRNLEGLYEHMFSFKDFEELTFIPARRDEMDDAGEKLRIVRLALKDLSRKRVGE